jgi:anti-sigma factor RsiW
MAQATRHPEDALQDMVDGRLDAVAGAELRAHLSGCAACRGQLEELRRLRARLSAIPGPAPPTALGEKIRQSLDRADRVPARWRWAVGAGLAAAVTLVAWLAWSSRPAAPPSAAAGDYRALRDGQLALALETADVARMERFFAAQGVRFETRVFDLAMMQYRLAGGRVHSLAGEPSALFAYRGPGGHLLLCEMYAGRTSTLPAAEEEREHSGMRFQVFHRGEVTLVFWQEADVVCVLAGDGDPEAVVRLAYAKAVKL